MTETLETIWNLFTFFCVLSVPQLLGILAYFRVRKYHDFAAYLLGFLIPPILFFYLAAVIFISSAVNEAQSRGEKVCGTFIGMTFFMILMVAGLQMFFSFIAQSMLHIRHKGLRQGNFQ